MEDQKAPNEDSVEQNQSDIFGKTGNGTLDFLLSSSPHMHNYSYDEVKWLDVSIHYQDLDAIYADALRSKNISPLPTDFRDNNVNFEKNRLMFVGAFPECSLLGAFYDMYGDYVFDPKTADRFKNECERFRLIKLSSEADPALRKLIYGCTEASKKNLYLIWVCD